MADILQCKLCFKTWTEQGKFPKECPYCGHKDSQPVANPARKH